MQKEIILQKGEKITFLDYTIQNSLNNDGLVLFKHNDKAKLYETHLGNYGNGTQEDIDNAKMAAICHFMIARPEHFASTIMYRLMGDEGQHLEFDLFKSVVEKEGLTVPKEIKGGGYFFKSQILFNKKPLKWLR